MEGRSDGQGYPAGSFPPRAPNFQGLGLQGSKAKTRQRRQKPGASKLCSSSPIIHKPPHSPLKDTFGSQPCCVWDDANECCIGLLCWAAGSCDWRPLGRTENAALPVPTVPQFPQTIDAHPSLPPLSPLALGKPNLFETEHWSRHLHLLQRLTSLHHHGTPRGIHGATRLTARTERRTLGSSLIGLTGPSSPE